MDMETTQNPRKLIVQSRHVITRYNRLLLYAGGIVLGVVVLSWWFVVATRRPSTAADASVRLVSSNQPLQLPEPPKPPPEPPLPDPPVVPQHFSLPQSATPQSRTVTPAKVDEDAKRRKDALLRALRASVKVDNFSLDETPCTQSVSVPAAAQSQSGPSQTLEIPPAWQHEPAWPQRTVPPESTPVGRHDRFWRGSSWGTSSQWLAAAVQPPRSPYQVNAGTVIPAILANALNSDLEGNVSALVTRDVFDSVAGATIMIPQGARVFGVYDADVQGNIPRLHIAFKTLYFPNGYSLALQGMPGVDGTGMAGVSDQVNRHFWQRYGSAAILSLITAGVSLAIHNHDGYYSYSPADAAVYGAGQVMGQAVAEDLRRNMRIRPTLTVAEGYVFNLMVTQDIVFPGPYPFTVQIAQGQQ
jgi:type IV secretory pathway VirB10-like protein